MALVVKDRVKETTTTTGTGTITLAGAVDGFQSFSAALADGDTTYYAISETSTGEWEVGLGTFTATGTTLARTTVLASSNAGSAVSLTAEADVFITQPAGKSVFFDGSGDLTLNQDPTSALHAATKEYVDTIAAAGLHYHDPVRVEQEGNLSATYNNGTAGVGATLTNNSTQAALSIDGVTLSLNDRVLIYEQTNAYENGVYTVTDTGSASTNWVLTRSTDTDSYAPSDPDSLGQGDAFFVLEGTAGAGELYVMNTEGTITFGTTGITFTQVAATAVFTAGDGLTLTGTTFAVGAGTGVTVNANDIAIGQAVGTSDSPTFAGMTTTADITFGTNDKASFGTTLDIYSDGTDSYVVEGGTGNLYIDSADLSIRNAAGTATMASFDDTGSVTLNHNNSTKLTTQSYGIDVTGNVQSDGLIVDGDAAFDTNTLFVDSTNNRVGIGNIAPATALDITGTVTADGLTVDGDTNGDPSLAHLYNISTGTAAEATAYITNSATKADGLFLQQLGSSFTTVGGFVQDGSTIGSGTGASGGLSIMTRAAADMRFYTNGHTNERMRIDSSGRVLIGRTSSSLGGGNGATLQIGSGSNAAGMTIHSNTTSTGDIQFADGTSGNASYRGLVRYDHSADYMSFWSSAAERMRIDSSGNVGIGRTSSAYGAQLSVQGGIETHSNQLNIAAGTSGVTPFEFVNRIGGGFDFYVNNATNLAARITSAGNVGIGTGSPAQKLEVSSGTSQALQLTTSSGGPWAMGLYRSDTGVNSKVFNNGYWAFEHNPRFYNGGAYNRLLHTGDEGSGNGLDADTVDGLNASSFLRSDTNNSYIQSVGRSTSWGVTNGTSTGALNAVMGTSNGATYLISGTSGGTFRAGWQVLDSGGSSRFYLNSNYYSLSGSTGTIWHSGNHGSGSGLDADTVDGLDSTAFIRSNANDNVSGHTEWQDNYSARFGAGADFRIYHNGTDNYLRNYNHAAGDIYIQGEDTAGTNHNIAAFYSSNAAPYVGLFYDGTEVLTTTSTGVNVVGTVTATSFSGDGSNLTNLPAATGISSTSSVTIEATGTGSDITLTANDNIILDGDIDLRATGTLTLQSGNNFQQNNLYAINGIGVRATYINSTNSYEDRIYSTSKSLVPYWFSRANYLGAIGNNPYGWRLIYMRDPGTGSDNLIRSDQWNAFTLSVPLKMASDERIKEDIQEIENPLDKVNKLNGYTYTWTTTKDKDAGVIAQEVEKVMPELVTEIEAEQNDEGFNRKTVNYNGLVGLLISAVKEQQKQIDELKAKIERQ